MDDFRRADELKYRLMPDIFAQSKDASERGLPMVPHPLHVPADAAASPESAVHRFVSWLPAIAAAPVFPSQLLSAIRSARPSGAA